MVTLSWSNSVAAKNPIQGGLALDRVDMEDKGYFCLPPVEYLLATHLHPARKSTMTSAGLALPAKANNYQSSLTGKRLEGGGNVGEGSECIVAATGLSGRVRGRYVNVTHPRAMG